MSGITTGRSAGYWLAWAAAVVATAAVVAGIVVIGPPGEQRAARMDVQRIQHLRRLAEAIDMHARVHDRIPSDLATLDAATGVALPTSDPDDGSPYTFERTGQWTYRLCATFAAGTDDARNGRTIAVEWLHPAGRHCFQRRARGGDKGEAGQEAAVLD